MGNRPRVTSEATHTGMPRHTTVKRTKLRSKWGSRGCQSAAARSASHFCHHCVYLGQKRNRNSHSEGVLGNFYVSWTQATVTWEGTLS